ncbi:MAG: RNA methyltransferase [Acidobacteria bacterium]|nr:RNA methyltransferase [Acidobacteriota bacterium]
MASITDLDDPRVADYRDVPDPVLLRERGVFVAEGRLVVRQLLSSARVRARSVLVSPTALDGLRDVLEQHEGMPVYVMDVTRLSSLVGFNVHRGCLAIGERPPAIPLQTLLDEARPSRLLVVIEHVGNADNIGGIFRNALAFGAGGVVLSSACCDPLYRKAIRVSMGASLKVPFAADSSWPAGLDAVTTAGFQLLAMSPAPSAVDIDDAVAACVPGSGIAVMLGHEGSGLTGAAGRGAGVHARIPMQPGVDSLNVSTAAGVALHACRRHLGWPPAAPGC